jgi:voltage-gated potassium channel
MKFLASQFTYFLSDRQARRNLGALRTYLYFLVGIVATYSVIFHLLMEFVEQQEHSWLTGLYWTLTVMSTLGFGDITFHSDWGRIFSIVVLLSGVVLLLIMLPFAFIRFFLCPLAGGADPGPGTPSPGR